MNPDFKLTTNDIKIKQENALESFYSGIKSQATKETLERLLKYFLIKVCADLLQGDFKQRAPVILIMISFLLCFFCSFDSPSGTVLAIFFVNFPLS